MLKIGLKILLFVLCFSFAQAEVQTVEKYTVNFSEVQSKALQGIKSPAVGSGIVLVKNGANQLDFLMITDRGPNVDGEKIEKKGEKSKDSTIFAVPSFSPFVAKLILQNNQANIVSVTKILNEDFSPSSGLPQSKNSSAIALDRELKMLGTKDNGIDPEGITVTKNGELWICEEYAPSLIKVDLQTGRIVKRFTPGNGLPAILAMRQENRGFEGIAAAENGDIVASLQSTLNIEEQTKDKATFIRFVKFNSSEQKTAMYAYPLSDIKNVDNGAVKIGDLAYAKDSKFIAIETYKDKSDKKHARIVLLDFSDATDITDRKINERELEFADELSGITAIHKEEILDLGSIGWDKDKTEALTLLPDFKTIMISHDNDFGFSREKEGKNKIKEENKVTEVWLISFKDKIV